VQGNGLTPSTAKGMPKLHAFAASVLVATAMATAASTEFMHWTVNQPDSASQPSKQAITRPL
jgi:hypothetical protein